MSLEFTANALKQGFNLHWYQIDKVLGSGGFGITYLAHDRNLNRPVAIKEYMPEEFAVRGEGNTIQPKTSDDRDLYQWGLERFIVEAQTLAQFSHPNIIRVLSVFEENNTAYMAMEYAQGRELSKLFKTEVPFNQTRLLDVFIPIIDGLSLVHNENFIHRDIKPANIYIIDNDKPVLLDFGSARQSIGEKSRTLTKFFTYGYAPYEQYHDGYAEQGPWTDIYALGACMYVGITGEKPVDAIKRGGGLLKGEPDPYIPLSFTHKRYYEENFLLAIDNALAFEADQRPQDTMIWAGMLLGEVKAPPLPKHMVETYSSSYEKTIVIPRKTATRKKGPAFKPRPSSRTEPDTDRPPPYDVQNLINKHGMRSAAPAPTFTGYADDKARARSKRVSGIAIFVTSILLVVALTVFAKFQFDLKMSDLVAFLAINENPGKPEENLATQVLQKQVAQNQVAEKQDLEKSNEPVTKTAPDAKSARKSQAIESLLTKADIAFIRKNYVGSGKSAASYFNEVLEIDPNNVTARNGLQKIESTLVENTRDAIKSNRLTRAKTVLAQLDQLNASSKLAKGLRAEISQIEAGKKEIRNLLSQAHALQQKNYLTRPKDNNAYAVYQQVLAKSPDNKNALKGIQEIQDHYVQQFNRHLEQLKLSKAEKDLQTLATIQLPQISLKQLQVDLSSKKSQVAKIRAEKARAEKALAEKVKAEKALAEKTLAQKSLIEQEQATAKTTTTTAEVQPVTVTMNQVSQMLGAFKTYMENQQFEELNRLSQFSPGRDQFLRQLFSRYRNMKISISHVQFIPSRNKANAEIKLSNLVSVDDAEIDPKAASEFQISLRLDQKQQLKIFW